MIEDLSQLVRSFAGRRVLLVGDLILDRYTFGDAERISPEAPVPVVDVASESMRLGGAANVANNVESLGGKAMLVGVIGDDHAGTALSDLLRSQGLATDGIVVEKGRRTTEKTRVIAHDQHVVRIDFESRKNCSPEAEQQIIDVIRNSIDGIDAIIFEDYNKGVVTRGVIRQVIEIGNTAENVITVDPKFENFAFCKFLFSEATPSIKSSPLSESKQTG